MSTNRNNRGTTAELEPARFVDGRALTIAGLKARFDAETRENIPTLWMRFMKHSGNVPAQVGNVAYGLCWPMDNGEFDYLAGMEVSKTTELPADFEVFTIPAQRYAIFTHDGHVSHLDETVKAIYEKWLPQSGTEIASPGGGAPDFFERYGRKFDPKKGTGDIEVWMPVEKQHE